MQQPGGQSDMAFCCYDYLHLINKNKRSLVSVLKESRNNFRSPLMKTLDRSVETLGAES